MSSGADVKVPEKVRKVVEVGLDPDETLLWAAKSRGVVISRPMVLALAILIAVNVLAIIHPSKIPWFGYLIIGWLYGVTLLGVFSPPFTYHAVTDRRILSKTNFAFPIEIGTQVARGPYVRVKVANWLGANSFLITETSFTRTKPLFGRFRLYGSFGLHFRSLIGVADPAALIKILNAEDSPDLDVQL